VKEGWGATAVILFGYNPVSGSSSAVERQLPKLDVTGSIPVSRSIFPRTHPRGVVTLLSRTQSGSNRLGC
jgi:hypothetical protein